MGAWERGYVFIIQSPFHRYDFVPPVKYNYLNADEAEERFERRNKTLNLFSVMLSKKLRGAEGEEEEGGGEGAEGGGAGRAATGGSSKGKGKAQDLGLVGVAMVVQDSVSF